MVSFSLSPVFFLHFSARVVRSGDAGELWSSRGKARDIPERMAREKIVVDNIVFFVVRFSCGFRCESVICCCEQDQCMKDIKGLLYSCSIVW